MKHSIIQTSVRVSCMLLGTLMMMLIIVVTSATAQDKKMKKMQKTAEERAVEAVTYWNKHLQLNEDQQGKFKTLLAEEFTKRDSIKTAVKDRKSRYEAFNKLRDETHAKMETILTPEQHKKFVDMRSKSWKKKGKKMKKPSLKKD